ncbi:hypothetical protein EHS11_00755 [Leptospira ilyithenensis]|uniref:Uncharacterized protein n=1 Tax=Leptospira ilyithenensis TaxID=2484901 RepID=A0A4R9LTA7_9LEPT|nr:hypothetical protein EHS11_00755 [Leptospira ilyithenensis]
MFVASLCFGLSLFAQDGNAKKLCSSFTDCSSKAEKTDIHRKKIQLYSEAITNFKSSDGEKNKISILLKRANSIIKEASGDTGYKGEIALKVTHKPEYKKQQFDKAREDLNLIEANLNLLNTNEQTLYESLKSEINFPNP